MNIDPQAVAVIDGQIVDEDTVIRDDVSMLSFVKPSAVKGALGDTGEVPPKNNVSLLVNSSKGKLKADPCITYW